MNSTHFYIWWLDLALDPSFPQQIGEIFPATGDYSLPASQTPKGDRGDAIHQDMAFTMYLMFLLCIVYFMYI